MLIYYKPNRSLRSTDTSQLVVPRVRSNQGEMAFSHYAVHCWNQLPTEMKSAPTVTSFKNKLKTHLFSIAFK